MFWFSFTVHSCHAEHGLSPEDPDADSVWCCSAKVKDGTQWSYSLQGGINVNIIMFHAFSYANSWRKCLYSAINYPHILIHASYTLVYERFSNNCYFLIHYSAINDPHVPVLIHAPWLLCIKGIVIVIFGYITVTPIRSTQELGAELKVRCCLVKL